MTKQKHKIRLPKLKKVHFGILRLLGLAAIPFVVFYILYFGKIYPGVTVAGINLSGRTPEQAIKLLANIAPPAEVDLIAQTETNQTFKIPTDSFGLSYDYNQTADAAYRFGRTGNPVYDLGVILSGFVHPKPIGLRLKLDEDKLATSIFTIAGQVGTDPVYPSAKLNGSSLVVNKGQKGTVLDANQLRILIGSSLAADKSDPIAIPVQVVDPTLNPFQEAAFEKRARAISTKTLKLNFEYQTLEFSGNDLLGLLNANGGSNADALNDLISGVATKVNRPPQEAKFIFNTDAKRVDTFEPSKNGVTVQGSELATKITVALEAAENSDAKEIALDIPVATTAPKTQTSDANNLGIKELLGRGASIFFGSINSRVYNIGLAASRISGTLVPPGETFSFNQAVGDISSLSGYQKAYIIENGKTVLGDGGGVCQVSTTLFRAVLNAGLPVVERTAHAYRVFYYEEDAPVGLDATVYSPTVDFKFKNDTSAYLLIQAYPDLRNYALVFEIYGTSDGRSAAVGKPVITEVTAPPANVYQNDPTLPAGTLKQTEHKAWGTKTYFNYVVTRNGETINQQTFYSTFRPWANVFLRGTGA